MSSNCNSCTSGTVPGASPPPAYPMFSPPVAGNCDVPSNGGSDSTSGSTTTGCPSYLGLPTLLESITIPAIGGSAQFRSQCAYQWAVPGAILFISPYGLLEIKGVTGDLVTYQNVSIAQGNVIQAGTQLVIGVPIPANSEVIQSAASLDRAIGFLGDEQRAITGTVNQVMRWNREGVNVRLSAVPGMLFSPNPNMDSMVSPEDNAGNSISTTPIAQSGTGVVAYYDLPNLPQSDRLPNTYYALVHIRLSRATAGETTEANALKALHNSREVASCSSSYVTHSEVLVPVTGGRLQLEFTKTSNQANNYARVWIIGYYF